MRGNREWGVLKDMLSNGRLGTNVKKCLYEVVTVPMALYGAES